MADNKNASYERDPEKNELKHLMAAYRLPGKSVLEIGCGNGILTQQYVHLPCRVIGIDPTSEELRKAATTLQASHSKSVFTQGMGEALPFPSQAFNLVIFASSL